MKNGKQDKKEIQHILSEVKEVLGNLIFKARLDRKEIRRGLMNGGVHSEQDTIQLNFQLVKRKCLRNFLLLKSNNKGKFMQMGFKEFQGPSQEARLQQCCPLVSGFTVMKHTCIKALWNLSPPLRRASEAGG